MNCGSGSCHFEFVYELAINLVYLCYVDFLSVYITAAAAYDTGLPDVRAINLIIFRRNHCSIHCAREVCQVLFMRR